MAFTNFVKDAANSGSLALPSSGSVTYDIPIPTDRVCRVFVVVICGTSSAGHANNGGSCVAEGVYKNNAGTVTACTALASSNNPSNSTTTTYVAAHAMAGDLSFGVSLTVSSTNCRVTITNNTATAQDAVVFPELWEVGYA